MQRSGNPAVRYGLIFGGIIGVLRLISTAIQYGTGGRRAFAESTGTFGGGRGGGALAFACLSLLIGLAIYFLAGMFAARETGRTGSGAISGLLAAIIGGAIGAVISVIAAATVPAADWYSILSEANTKVNSPSEAKTAAIIVVLILAVVGLLIAAGVGAGVGALGGLAGKGRYNGPVNPYQQSFYQGPQGFSPPPGYPPTGYPPQGTPGSYPPPGNYPPPGAYPPSPRHPVVSPAGFVPAATCGLSTGGRRADATSAVPELVSVARGPWPSAMGHASVIHFAEVRRAGERRFRRCDGDSPARSS